MVNVVTRSPFESYLMYGPTGPKMVTAFQEGAANAEQLETQRATREREQALLPFRMQEYRTTEEIRRQALDANRASAEAFGAAANNPPGAGTGATPPAGSGFIPAPTAQAQALRTQLMPTWQGLEQSYNLPAGYLDRAAAIESSYNPTAQREGSQYVGLFQIGPEAASDLRMPLDARTDPVRSSEAAAQYAARNAQTLQRALGRQPTGWELYLAHQQGAGGATALLTNAQQPALDVLTRVYGGNRERATQAIVQNGGRLDMTAGQFASLWQNKFGVGAAPPSAAGATAAAPPAAGLAAPGFNLPAGAISPTMMSTGGVPMTPPNPDLAAAGAGESQFMVPGPGGMTPVAAPAGGMPLDAQGRPVTGQPAGQATDPRVARIAEIDARIADIARGNNERLVARGNEPIESPALMRFVGSAATLLSPALMPPGSAAAQVAPLVQERNRLLNEISTDQRFPRGAAEEAVQRLQAGDYAGAAGRLIGGAIGERGINTLSSMFPRATAQVQSTAEEIARQRAAGNQVGSALTNIMSAPRVVGSALYDVFAPPVTAAAQFGLTALGGTVPSQPTAAPAPSVGLSQPMPGMLGGATPIAPAGFQPAMTGGTQTPGAISPAPIAAPAAAAAAPAAGLPAGVTVARPNVMTGEAPGARTPAAAASATSAAAERVRTEADRLPPRYGVFDRSEVKRERDTLDQQMTALMNQRRIAIATRNAQLLNEVDTALIAANRKSDMLNGMEAVAALDTGDPRPIADYFYRRTNGRMQLQQNSDGTYNVLDSGTVTQRNMSAAELARYARSDVDYRVREEGKILAAAKAKRQELIDKTNEEIRQKTAEQRGALVSSVALEEVKAGLERKGIKTEKGENGALYIIDLDNRRIQIATPVTRDRQNNPLPRGQFRLDVIEANLGAVPTQ